MANGNFYFYKIQNGLFAIGYQKEKYPSGFFAYSIPIKNNIEYVNVWGVDTNTAIIPTLPLTSIYKSDGSNYASSSEICSVLKELSIPYVGHTGSTQDLTAYALKDEPRDSTKVATIDSNGYAVESNIELDKIVLEDLKINGYSLTGDVNYIVQTTGTTTGTVISTKVVTDEITRLDNNINNRVIKNNTITPNTSTKIIFDSKGLVTSGGTANANELQLTPFDDITGTTIDLGLKQMNDKINQNPSESPAEIKTVGSNNANYATIKEAVDVFNGETVDWLIRLNPGTHLVNDTITVNNTNGNTLTILGSGSSNTFINTETGLTNKPMWQLISEFAISRFSLDATTLANYGNLSTEIVFNIPNTTPKSTYFELQDYFSVGGYKFCSDNTGADIYSFNFEISDCINKGFEINYTTTGVTDSMLDIEVGNINNCPIGVDLLSGDMGNFHIAHIMFNNTTTGDTAIRYNTNFSYQNRSSIINSIFNHIGEFITGIDWSLEQNADIEMSYNIGIEDMSPHASFEWDNNVSGTTCTLQNTKYKIVGVNSSSYSKKITVSNNRLTYLSNHERDGEVIISAAVQSSATGRRYKLHLIKNGDFTTSLGSMAVNINVSNAPQPVSFPAYIEESKIGDFYEVWIECTSTAGTTVIVTELSLQSKWR